MRGGKDLSLPLDSRANPSPSDLLVARNRPRILLMNPTPRRGKCRAFTLPEIFIALGIFGVLLSLLFLVHHAEREAEEETRATLIASAMFGVGKFYIRFSKIPQAADNPLILLKIFFRSGNCITFPQLPGEKTHRLGPNVRKLP